MQRHRSGTTCICCNELESTRMENTSLYRNNLILLFDIKATVSQRVMHIMPRIGWKLMLLWSTANTNATLSGLRNSHIVNQYNKYYQILANETAVVPPRTNQQHCRQTWYFLQFNLTDFSKNTEERLSPSKWVARTNYKIKYN